MNKEFNIEDHKVVMAVDIIVLKFKENTNEVLLIKRKNEPLGWALPGGLVDKGETCLQAAIRELKEETNIDTRFLTFIDIADEPNRDPRGRTISAIFIIDNRYLIDEALDKIMAGDDASDYRWASLEDIEKGLYDDELVFDHKQILTSYSLNGFLD